MRLADEVVDAFEIEEDVVHGLRTHGVRRVVLGVDSEVDDVADISAKVGSVGVGDLVVAEEDVSGAGGHLLRDGFQLVVVDDGAVDLARLEGSDCAATSSEHTLDAEVRARPEGDVSRVLFEAIVQVNGDHEGVVAHEVMVVVGSSRRRGQAIDLPIRVPVGRGHHGGRRLGHKMPTLLVLGLLFIDAVVARVLEADEGHGRRVKAGANQAGGEGRDARGVEQIQERLGGNEFRAARRVPVGEWDSAHGFVDGLDGLESQLLRDYVWHHHEATIQELLALGIRQGQLGALRKFRGQWARRRRWCTALRGLAMTMVLLRRCSTRR